MILTTLVMFALLPCSLAFVACVLFGRLVTKFIRHDAPVTFAKHPLVATPPIACLLLLAYRFVWYLIVIGKRRNIET